MTTPLTTLAYNLGCATAHNTLTKTASLDLVAAGMLGALKAAKSKKHPDEELEGALRGVGGWFGGGVLGGTAGSILGAAAGALLSGGHEVPTVGGAALGGVGGLIYGGVKGYKSLTKKYDE